MTLTYGSWSEGHHDLYFTVQWFLSYILKTIWSMNSILWDYKSVWPDVLPQINIGHCDLYFMVQRFFLIPEECLMYAHHTSGYVSAWHDIWPQNKCRSLWPIIHCPVILPYILKNIWYMNTILWDYKSGCPKVWPKINVGHCDLYFMVQWFCLIFGKLFSN